MSSKVRVKAKAGGEIGSDGRFYLGGHFLPENKAPQPMPIRTGRAKAGGQVGMNGETYKGGQFLPNTQLPKQGGAPRSKAKRSNLALIEPGVLVDADEGQVAIFGSTRDLVYVEGGVMRICPHLDNDEHPCWNYHGTREECQQLCDRYNRGERWR